MRKSAFEKMIEMRRKGQKPQHLTLDEMMLLLLDGRPKKEERQANPTQRACIYDPDRIVFYMGPAGCAKTSTIVCKGMLRSILEPGSAGLISRANYNDLTDTTAKRAQEMLGRLPKGVLLDRDKSPPMKWYLDVMPSMSPEGDILCDDPSTITFMGLQDGLGSYEFSWAAIDEIAEVEEMRVHEVNTRLRHMPKSWPEGADAYGLYGAFNPPDKHHWLYTACTGKDFQERPVKTPWVKLYIPQPKENVRNLPTNYYDNLANTLPEDMRVRLVEGLWGSTFEGQPVFREFRYGLHAMDGVYAKYDQYTTLYRFWDFGYRHPFCIWAQMDMEGRLLAMREHMGENLEIQPFAQHCKKLTEKWFPGAKDIIDYGDPAARQKKDTGSTLVELSKEGITLRWKLQSIDPGLREIRIWLERMISGQPALQFDKRYVPILIDALRGGYKLDDTGQKPVKDGFYDHPADTYRYGLTNVFGGGIDHNAIAALPSSVAYDPAQDRDYQRPQFNEVPEHFRKIMGGD